MEPLGLPHTTGSSMLTSRSGRRDEGLARAHSSQLGSPRKHPVALAHCRPNWSPRPMVLSKTLREPLNHPKTQLSKHSRHNGSVYT